MRPSLLLSIFLLPTLLANLQAAERSRPNIVFIFADDWGYGDVGVHGSTFCETPHLDRMAKEGTDFANFTVNSPVCSPSRVAVMTGQFPARHCIHQHFQSVKAHINRGMPDWVDPQAPMLPRMLKNAGYTTGLRRLMVRERTKSKKAAWLRWIMPKHSFASSKTNRFS